MDFFNIPKQDYSSELSAGKLLIAEPFLADPNFGRAVVLICEHNEEGTVGFIINKPTQLTLKDLLPDYTADDIVLKEGGPVQTDTLHVLHRLPELGGVEVAQGVYWGITNTELDKVIAEQQYNTQDLSLFIGYAGWSAGQLLDELKIGSWYVGNPTEKLVFDTDTTETWRAAVISLGKEYLPLLSLPSNPQLN
ncbi:MAG: YqgE/AlgH family protein [Bacteroidetes bacterium]|nr:YqgE/AlgH family protein [Bacteroidota bacterium]